jgi:hypothetical protein
MDTRFDGGSFLQTSFYTDRGMQYFPNSGYLTQPQLGAYRQSPDISRNYQATRPGLLQSALIGYQAMPGANIVDSYVMGADSHKNIIQARRKVSDAVATLTTSLVDTAITSAVTALGMGALGLTHGGLLGGVAGLAIGAVMPGITSPIADRIRQTRMLQQLTMSKIVAGPDVDTALGQGFSTSSAGRIDRVIRQLSSSDTLLKDKDYRQIMNLGVEGGMFDYSTSSGQYISKLKVLVNNFKVMMEMLETADPKAIQGTMSRLMRMGVAPENMINVVSQERMAARMLGIQHSEMVNTYGQQGALLYSSAGLTPYIGSMEGISNAASYTMMQRLGLVSPSVVARNGGISGITQQTTGATANVSMSPFMSMLLMSARGPGGALDRGKLMELINNPNVGANDILKSGTERYNELSKTTSPAEAWQIYSTYKKQATEDLFKGMSPQEKDSFMSQVYQKYGATMITGKSGESPESLRMRQIRTGIQFASGIQDPEQQWIYFRKLTDPRLKDAESYQAKVESEKRYAAYMNQELQSRSLESRMKRGIRQFQFGLEDKLGKYFGEYYPRFENWMGAGDTNPFGSNANSFMMPGPRPGSTLSGGGYTMPGVDKGILDAINKASNESGVDPQTMMLIANFESTMNPNAVNPASNATGLYQFMPGTWNDYAKGVPFEASKNPYISTMYRAKMLKDNIASNPEIANDPVLAVMSSLGAGNIQKIIGALKTNPNTPLSALFSPLTISQNKWNEQGITTVGQLYAMYSRKVRGTQARLVKKEAGASPALGVLHGVQGVDSDLLDKFNYTTKSTMMDKVFNNVLGGKSTEVSEDLKPAMQGFKELLLANKDNLDAPEDIENLIETLDKFTNASKRPGFDNMLSATLKQAQSDPILGDKIGKVLNKYKLGRVKDLYKSSNIKSKDAFYKDAGELLPASGINNVLGLMRNQPTSNALEAYTMLSMLYGVDANGPDAEEKMKHIGKFGKAYLGAGAGDVSSVGAFAKFLAGNGWGSEDINSISEMAKNKGVDLRSSGMSGFNNLDLMYQKVRRGYNTSAAAETLSNANLYLRFKNPELFGVGGDLFQYVSSNEDMMNSLLSSGKITDPTSKQILSGILGSKGNRSELVKLLSNYGISGSKLSTSLGDVFTSMGINAPGLAGPVDSQSDNNTQAQSKSNDMLLSTLSNLNTTLQGLTGVLKEVNEGKNAHKAGTAPVTNVYDGER